MDKNKKQKNKTVYINPIRTDQQTRTEVIISTNKTKKPKNKEFIGLLSGLPPVRTRHLNMQRN